MTQPHHDIDGIICIDFANGGELPDGVDNPRTRAAVVRFRRVIHRLLRAEALGVGAAEGDLRALNRILTQGQNHRGVLPSVRGYGWGWLAEGETSGRALWPVAWSAAQLLTGPDLNRLKGCDGCGRLYFDRSRNRSRRWCEMEGCGNRAKVRRHRGGTG